jgi:hypothetical protein
VEAMNVIKDKMMAMKTEYHFIFEPANGNSAISNVLEDWGFNVIKRDLFTMPEKHDFLTAIPPPRFDIIVTSPPLAYQHDFLRRCIEIGKPFVLLLPADIFSNKKYSESVMGLDVNVLFICGSVPLLHDGKWKDMGPKAWYFGNFPDMRTGLFEIMPIGGVGELAEGEAESVSSEPDEQDEFWARQEEEIDEEDKTEEGYERDGFVVDNENPMHLL